MEKFQVRLLEAFYSAMMAVGRTLAENGMSAAMVHLELKKLADRARDDLKKEGFPP